MPLEVNILQEVSQFFRDLFRGIPSKGAGDQALGLPEFSALQREGGSTSVKNGPRRLQLRPVFCSLSSCAL
ncbi:MAG: hypothetical protein JW759_07905 [Candidatus Coatesbacteria bacterium]|nr:hypothetical protein [Candidatus Coatesbacteria bacterium]